MEDFLISYIVVLFSAIIFILSYKKLTDKLLKISGRKIIMVLLFCVLTMINNIYNVYIFRMIMGYLILYMICKTWFKDSFPKTAYYSVIIAITSIMTEFITIKFFSSTFLALDDLNKSMLVKNAITIIISVMVYFILSLSKIKKFINKKEKIAEKKISNEILMYIIFISLNIIMLQYNVNYKDNMIYISSVGIIFLISGLVIYLLRSNYKREKLKIKNQYLNDSIKNYETIADDYSELRHNLNYDFMAIRSLANKKAQEIIDEKIKKYNKNYNWISNLSHMPKGIQGIICVKLYEGKNKGINMEINTKVKEEINERINNKEYAILCDILGITIDNAIEATEKSDEKSIYIELNETEEQLEVKIMNTFKDIVDLNKIGSKNYSTKKIKSGIGLNYINKASGKNIQIKKEIINNVFIISIFILLK